ncbi:RAD9, HUS1, RAD1-interacting nuclear orphan protein 1 isoform 1-T2 [Anomaloglossus baeobatrachus]|uniref:RAD9, HUS1, RAD1-interacting nuclear orphan protein 1 n=1 Tax=Anomaloglossus baeobatrachus TaxID=238106 RepID=UPI003F500D6F
MPPKKRTACNPRKPRLLFLESPEDGPVHEYGAAPPKAEKTKCVPTRPPDHNSSTSWVSPQFDQAPQLHFPPRQRRRRGPHVSDSSAAHVNQSQHRAPGRKPSVCRFPPLSFSAAEILETQSFGPTRRRTEQNVPTMAPTSPPVTGSPPDIQTPETRPEQNPLLSPCAAYMQTPLSRRLAEAPDTPPAAGPGQVLAEDTPEQEYGLRLTWRRRRGLMKFLKSRGRLESSEILVKP